ncbi:efflux RND transporter periplasmic adaptor subunit [Paenibacillus glycinis]|uniref:Efflux RND transporter periplasmic adaptor subunit n=1 Tax=Paenibacillus glycinis TaxID=2697035 RepID=A0ABW9Y066_9BACL|nr:efflux RND transporter periplasmic adaptor subunit [Paenibacillus glycinis]NBD27866.1 efflux RND transporter periplasmic adaptor subunit [Paenibacillus glycinis]
MQEVLEETGTGNKKKSVRLAAALFLGGMLALTFFSNTYQGLTLPKVQTDVPSLGALRYTIEGNGTFSAHRLVPLYDRTGWTVKSVNVLEGDPVKKGETLAELDTEQATDNLADERTRYHKLELQLEQLQLELKQNAMSGGEDAIDQAKLQIESLQDDMAIQQRRIVQLEEQIDTESAVKAPFDGIIASINAVEGLPNSQGQPVVVVSDLSQGFDLITTIDTDLAAHIQLGKTVNLMLQDEKPRSVKATVTELKDAPASGASSPGGKLMTLTVKDASLFGGEQASFQWTESGGERTILVPKGALHEDDLGTYIFVLKEEKKPLGDEFTVQIAYVTVGDSDSTSTAITGGLMPTEKIVTDSSAPLSDGDRVRAG